MCEFDRFSKNYDLIHNKNIRISGESSDYFSEYKVKELNSFFLKHKMDKRVKILDVGCGIGKIEKYLFSYFPSAIAHGIDPSSRCIEEAIHACKDKRAIFQVYDGENIPFADDSFDVILFACVLHHILPAKREKILNESYRVLRKNAHLFIFEHNLLNPLTFYVVRTCDFDKDAKFLYRWDIERLLSRTNFEIIEKKYITFFPHFLRRLRKYEKIVRNFPIGAQYFIVARKGKV
ncbi:MAG: methyltransferase domain-containing protein [bacterium]